MSMKPNPLEASTEPVAVRVSAGLSKIGQALKSKSWAEAGRQGLTPTQGQILAYLATQKGGHARLVDIATALGITTATTSEAVRILEKKGVISKRPDATDGRALQITLGGVGWREAGRVADWPAFLVNAIAQLPNVEQEAMLRTIMRTIVLLMEQQAIPLARMCVTCEYFRPNAHPEDAERPHHCALVDAPYGNRLLRVDCPEHVAASEEQRKAAQEAWIKAKL